VKHADEVHDLAVAQANEVAAGRAALEQAKADFEAAKAAAKASAAAILQH
jgi:hypothetical protein